jgi:cytochrome bd-type quinol oxidase subunit 1
VLTAFFLEATFLGVMLFGFRRVPGWLHTVATFLVAFGTTASAFWILVLNSWMHTPAGFEMIAIAGYLLPLPLRIIYSALSDSPTAFSLILFQIK